MAGARPQRRRTPRAPAGPRRRPSAVLPHVRPLVERLSAERELVLWDVEFVREAGRETLRISVDRPGGVAAGELGELAETLSRALDETDAVPGDQRYWLEVTSPGAERKLRSAEQFAVCRGRLARVTFKDGREPLEGTIGDVTDDAVEVGSARVGFDEISQARLRVPGV